MDSSVSSSLKAAISSIRSRDSAFDTYSRLKEAMQIASEITVKMPEWIIASEIISCEDIDNMLDKLPNWVESLYNMGEQICVMAPDLFLAHAGFERAGKLYSSALYTPARGVRSEGADINNPAVVFIQADQDMPIGLSINPAAVILLCPARFTSAQLAWIGEHRRANGKMVLFDVDHTDSLALCVRKNDINALEFMFARWELEKDQAAKDLQLVSILAHLEAIAWEADYETGK